MNTIIIPIDFSGASVNAIRYAAALSCDRAIGRIVLLHVASLSVYDNIPAFDNGVCVTEERQKAEELLVSLSRMLLKDCPRRVKVQTTMSESPLLRAIHRVQHDVQGDLILVGVDATPDGSYLSEHVIGLARTSKVPVLVVPGDCRYEPVREAMVVMQPGQEVMASGQGAGEAEPVEWVKTAFGDPGMPIYTAGGADPVQDLLDNMVTEHAQLIVVLPGRRSLFYRLTHRDITRAIARNSHYPVLLLK